MAKTFAQHRVGTKQIVSMSLDQALVKRIEALAAAHKKSRSAMIEDLIEQAIEHEEQLVAALQNPVMRQAVASFMNPDVVREMMRDMVGKVDAKQVKQVHEALQMGFANVGTNQQAAEKPAENGRAAASGKTRASKSKRV